MERELVERARSGDREAFAALAVASIGRLFNVAQLMLRDRDLAEDAVQETLVLAWRDLKGLRNLDTFEAWLHRVLVRTVYREARRERRRSPQPVGIGLVRTLPDSTSAVEARDTVERAFRRLRPEHRAVLVLRHYLGFNDEDAAIALDVPVGTVKSRLNRAQAALRSEVEADERIADRLVAEAVR